ncbi:MAG: MerR family transcriptional regulator, partial [Defluviitaleaceae bacterium]|nr:MerR family transcriptional regulator [Defluviitaleaceae bacterium]
MDLQPIGVISKRLNVSVRTIRYYEQIGLIKSARKGDGAYRYFDGDAARRLRQIIVLRKLRIPLKQISEILRGDDISSAINYFEQNLSELGDEITALSTIKSILESFVARLNRAALVSVQLGLLDDESL